LPVRDMPGMGLRDAPSLRCRRRWKTLGTVTLSSATHRLMEGIPEMRVMLVRPIGPPAVEGSDELLQRIAGLWGDGSRQELDGQNLGRLSGFVRPLDQGSVHTLGYVQGQGVTHRFSLHVERVRQFD